MNATRTLPLLLIATSADPDSDPDAFDHATEVYADWPEILEHCERSQTGQHQYEAKDGFRKCIHCGMGDGVC